MIIDIPTEKDFAEQAYVFLNLAWDTVFDLLFEYEFADEEGSIVEKEQTEEYWKAAQRPFATAVALSQQGAEFLLKSKISHVSSFLLLNGKPNNWPAKCEKENTSFSSFHTADAQDLVKIHDTVATVRLSEVLKTLFNKLRLKRNTIFHTVDKNLTYTAKEIITCILTIVKECADEHKWIVIRRKYLEESPTSAAWSQEHVSSRITREMLITIQMLGDSELVSHFGFSKKQRRYICPNCRDNIRNYYPVLIPDTAQLKPNNPKSTNVYCFVCTKDIQVTRNKCDQKDCKGNVIHSDPDYECLSCYEPQIK